MRSQCFRFFFASISLLPLAATADDGFAIIQDPDGFTNVREESELTANVVGKAVHGSLVYCTGDEKNGWLAISFRDEDEEKYGFVHGSRTLPVSKFTAVPATTEDARRMVFSSDPLKVEIEIEDFDPKKSTITKDPSIAPDFVKEIDGKPFWGTDGGLPHSKYASIVITQGDKRTELPAEAISNLFEPNLTSDLVSVAHDEKSDTVIISACNSDGAGGYMVAFRIVKGVYTDRCILGPF